MQKKYLILLMLCGTIAPAHNTYARATKEHSSNSSSSDHHDKDKKCNQPCNQPIQITAKDINRDGKGYKIKEPGYYVLCEDTVFKPEGSKNQVAITINSNNVTLDLAGHTLSQQPSKEKKEKHNATAITTSNVALNLPSHNTRASKKTHNATGIAASNVNSIEIINGAITDFNIAGIKIVNCSNVEIEEIDILRTGKPSAFGGLQINESSDIIINQLRSLQNFGTGMYLRGVIKVTLSDCDFNDTVGGNVAPAFFHGSGLVGAGAYVDSSPNPDGSLKTETSTVSFYRCRFNHNTGGGEGVGMEVGPYSLLRVRDITIVDCEFLDNFMTGVDTEFNDSSGLALVQVDNFVLQNCQAHGQRHPSAPGPLAFLAVAGATGFSINGCNNGVIENCQAYDNVGQGSTSLGMRLRGCTNITVQNCECASNINTGTGEAFGFYTDSNNLHSALPGIPVLSTGLVFDSCTTENNFAASGSAGGFKIATLQMSTIQNCISQDNPIGILVIDPSFIMPSQQTLHNIFKENIVQGNTLFGIQDTVTGSDNAYFENTARTNGTNYSGLPSGTPFVAWNILGAALVATNPFANLNITP